jgi:hypothetical protein
MDAEADHACPVLRAFGQSCCNLPTRTSCNCAGVGRCEGCHTRISVVVVPRWYQRKGFDAVRALTMRAPTVRPHRRNLRATRNLQP